MRTETSATRRPYGVRVVDNGVSVPRPVDGALATTRRPVTMGDMTELAYAPPPEMATSGLTAALQRMSREKQAEIYWRLMSAIERNDQQELDFLGRVLRALAEGLPGIDESTARTVSIEEFRREFGIRD